MHRQLVLDGNIFISLGLYLVVDITSAKHVPVNELTVFNLFLYFQ